MNEAIITQKQNIRAAVISAGDGYSYLTMKVNFLLGDGLGTNR